MQRFAPLAVLLVTTLLAAGSAAGLNLALGLVIAPSEEVAKPKLGSSPLVASANDEPAATRVLSQEAYLDGIRRRNIFDAAYITAYNPAVSAAGGGLPVSDLKLKLLATMVANPAAFSSALIAGDSGSGGYAIGDTIRGTGATVVLIEQDRVKIRGTDGEESYLMMEQEGAVVASGESAPAAGGEEGISSLGENKFAISKDTLAKYMADPTQLASMGRALLHRGPDGEYDGYRLSAIRRGSLLDSLGVKNGDVIHTMNGQPLNSMQAAMGMTSQLAGGNNFQLEVSRRGQKMTLDYEVQ